MKLHRRTVLLITCSALPATMVACGYSESVSVSGAIWGWECRANTDSGQLRKLAIQTISRTPNVRMNNDDSFVATIDWPPPVGLESGENSWQLFLIMDPGSGDSAQLSLVATFFHHDGLAIGGESQPTPEAMRRLKALIQDIEKSGAKWGLTSIRGLHTQKR